MQPSDAIEHWQNTKVTLSEEDCKSVVIAAVEHWRVTMGTCHCGVCELLRICIEERAEAREA